ncbi:hypothetical protein [Arthrobacter sp. A5]|uniref:hypothetical protein n=1 Tax=Arthrobacter sp. A5 TaxID=576926 RepID=UPI003DA80822
MQSTNTITLPMATAYPNSGAAVEHFKGTLEATEGQVAISRARTLWAMILDTGSIPGTNRPASCSRTSKSLPSEIG